MKKDSAHKILVRKGNDVACALRAHCKVYIVNASRAKSQCVPHDLLEGLKDGSIFSGKFHSSNKDSDVTPHVVVMMNEFPNPEALSKDRHHVIELEGIGESLQQEEDEDPFYEDNMCEKAIQKLQQKQEKSILQPLSDD